MASLAQAALETLKRLREAGHAAYFVGGCVRDRLLGREVKEFDLATSALPEEVERLFPRTVPVGKAFGVILVLADPHRFEVATFRADGRYLDGRRPERVTFADARADALRRDFTINGLMHDPIEDRILDVVGGRADLEAKRIRAIGDPRARFEEDRLRMLRAVRFACQLEFAIEPATEAAMVELAPAISGISQERIRDELRKMLLTPRRAEGLELLDRTGLLKPILPEIARMRGVPQPPDWHPEGDVWTHTVLSLRRLEDADFELAMATMLHDVGKPRTLVIDDRIRFNRHAEVGEEMSREIGRRLRLSNPEIDRIAWLVGRHLVFKDVADMRRATLKRLVNHRWFDDLLKLHRADMLGGKGDLTHYDHLRQLRREFAAEPPPEEPLVTGDDLIAMGLPPGPRYREILREIEDARLEGRVRDRESALAMVRKLSGPPSP